MKFHENVPNFLKYIKIFSLIMKNKVIFLTY